MRHEDALDVFDRMQVRHARCVWVGETLGWLEDDDVSLTYSAARREVTRHAGGRAVVVGDDPFTVLEAELAEGPADARWFGYLGYAARPDLPASPDPHLPDAVWMRPARVAIRRLPRSSGVGCSTNEGDRWLSSRPAPGRGGVSKPTQTYTAAFAAVQEELHAGNSYEVNLTYREEVRSELGPGAAYLRLREVNPAPYAGFLQHDVAGVEAWLLSSSPERYARIGADRVIETRPIKGTTPRGVTAEEDEAARVRLATDPKFRAENLMIVDLLRNDLAMVCEVGSVEVPALMQVESYAAVHQLVSTVRGRLRGDVSTVRALRALFPAGSMTGAPKLRTMQIIDAIESGPRGAYAGAFGWVDADGRADLGVVIRSLTTTGDGAYRLGTGGGITVGSQVADEWAETRWKADRLLRALVT